MGPLIGSGFQRGVWLARGCRIRLRVGCIDRRLLRFEFLQFLRCGLKPRHFFSFF
ncbi:MAG: hypothetical protein RL739_386, partial [Pseudomonadota bacterium]